MRCQVPTCRKDIQGVQGDCFFHRFGEDESSSICLCGECNKKFETHYPDCKGGQFAWVLRENAIAASLSIDVSVKCPGCGQDIQFKKEDEKDQKTMRVACPHCQLHFDVVEKEGLCVICHAREVFQGKKIFTMCLPCARNKESELKRKLVSLLSSEQLALFEDYSKVKKDLTLMLLLE